MPKRRRAKRKRNGGKDVDQRWVKALGHELRVEILGILVERMASPNELAKITDEGLSQVSYHVKVLKDYECIKLVKTEPRRGAVEHYYRATSDTLLPAKRWRGAAGGARTVVGAGQASDLFNDLADAADHHKLADADCHISRILLTLDATGWKNVRAGMKRLAKEVEKEQQASAAREAEASESGSQVKSCTVGLLAFENSRVLAKETRQRARKAKATSSNGKGARSKRRAGNGKRGSSRNGSKRKAKTVAK